MSFNVGKTADDKYWMIRFEIEDEIANKEEFEFKSSYHVLGARLLGLTYPNYLKFCSSKGATFRGKTGYTYPVWKEEKNCKEVCTLLNREWNKVKKILIEK